MLEIKSRHLTWVGPITKYVCWKKNENGTGIKSVVFNHSLKALSKTLIN